MEWLYIKSKTMAEINSTVWGVSGNVNGALNHTLEVSSDVNGNGTVVNHTTLNSTSMLG